MTILDGYKITESVYHSQSTQILRAIRETDDLPVILKIRSDLLDVEHKTGLAYEYELGKMLEGEHLVRYLILEQTGQKTILVLQDDKMSPLEPSIPKGGLDLPRFLKLATEITWAIEEIHAQGVIHKDINPSNIIVNASLNSVKLIDFGLATRINEEMVGFETPAVLQGTTAYISPEQTGRINKLVDLRSDLYSLGVTLYQLITGKTPFDTINPGELIYSHIARKPVSVFEIRQDIPRALSMVIEKLLKKSPDERYQTAAGVKKDLLFVQNALNDGKNIIGFQPGQKEYTGKILLSGKLYGREIEMARLLDCFSKPNDTGQIITVTGPPGIGKTALIRELYTPITIQKGFFLTGKFDQFKKGLAYTALADGLKDFVNQSLGQDKDKVEIWKTAVRSSAGDFGQVLTDIVPDFQRLIGKRPDIAPVPPLETITRRNTVFSNLLKDICEVGYPVVLFLDDLQWSDSATLSLLEIVIQNIPKHFTIILSYRDDEISSAHPAKLFLERINNNEIELIALHLNNLGIEALNKWMDDILPDAGAVSEKLATQVMVKTGGNPFYITTFLHLLIEKNYIEQKTDGKLTVDMDAIIDLPVDPDIVNHLVKKIKNLKDRDREFLTQVSILGNRFSLDTIGLFLGEKPNGYQNAIEALVNAHLLVKSGDSILFAHDRIQQAARSMLNDEKARTLHLKAGQNIRAALDARDSAHDHIEEYIHHYNAAADLIVDKNTRQELANLNFVLAKRLKNNAAYQATESFFAQAISFLPPEPFETDYNLAIDLFTEYGEVLFLNLKYEQGEKLFDTVISRSKSPLDSAKAYVKQIKHHASHHNLKKSMAISFHALETLGIKLPKRFLKVAFIKDLLKIKRLLKNKKPEDVLDFPVTENPLVLAQMDVLSAAALAAYLTSPDHFPLIFLRSAGTSIIKGNCRSSPSSYMGYAIILIHLGDVDMGYAYGKIALKLMEKLDAKHLFTRQFYGFATYIHHWKAPAQDSIGFYKTAIAKGAETGDYEYAAYAASVLIYTSFYMGKNIDTLLRQFPRQHRILAGFGKDHSIYNAKYWNQFLITLNDPDGDGVNISGDIIDGDWLCSLLEERQDLSSLALCGSVKMQLSYLAGDYETAKSVSIKVMELLKALKGTMFFVVSHFFIALTAIAYYRNHKEKASYLTEAKQSLKKLRKWGKHAPENYLYKAQLVEAELLSVQEKQAPALKLFEAAIDNAQRAGNSLDLGIACECMGRYLISLGLESLGLIQIRRSIDVFQNWGALNKSTRLQKEYHIENRQESFLSESTGSDHSSQTTNATLDLDALTGTIRALTIDLNFDSLLATLLTAIMQRSGATRVVYIHVDQESLEVRGEKLTHGNVNIIKENNKQPASFGLKTDLLEKCRSGVCEHVLENIQTEKKPPQVEQHAIQYKSILIIPLSRQNSVKGMVYLENDLLENAFRENHVQFLSLLAGQAAIAMENALVFENLNAERDYSTNIIRNSPSLICGIDGNGITTFINPVIEKLTGYRKDELIGRSWWELLYPGEEYEQVDRLFKALGYGEIVDHEMTLTCRNGKKKNIVWNSFTRREDNNILEIIGFGNDITDQKRAEKALKESDERYRSLFYNNPIETITVDNKARVTGYNKAKKQSDGNLPNIGDIMYKDYASKHKIDMHNELMDCIQLSVSKTFPEQKYQNKYLQINMSPFQDGAIITSINITKRKLAIEALRESEEKYRLLVENASDAIYISQDGVIKFPNRKAEELTGYSAEEMYKMPFVDVIHPDDRVNVINRHRMWLTGEHPYSTYTFKIINKSGLEKTVQLNAVLIQWEDKPATLNFLRDITQQTKIETQLQQAQKMESIGTLAGGIAHDFNNILSGIFGYTQLLQMKLKGNSEMLVYLNSIFKAGNRAKNLVQQILAFSRQAVNEFSPMEIAIVLKEALKLIRSSLPSTIEINQTIKNDCGLVLGDSTQIHQIIMNLCTNAYHAMEETGGKLTIILKEVESGTEDLKDPSMIPGPHVCLTVADTGKGIEPGDMDRIFEPYFTTKEKGKGTGLGLAVIHGIVKSHGGHITVDSEPGKGSEFKVYLPAINHKQETTDTTVYQPIQKGSEQILLVDDQKDVVDIEQKMLESLGYQVTSRTDSMEALETFRTQPDKFDLVITDMTMPDMTGDILAAEIMKIHQKIPVLLCSGFSEQMSAKKAKSLGIKGFIMKPVVISDLSVIIRKVLDK